MTKSIYYLIKLRTRMTELKMNFKNMYVDQICPLCWLYDDSQSHLLECKILKENCVSLKENMNVKYKDIFGNMSQQKKAVDLFEKIWITREKLLDENKN